MDVQEKLRSSGDFYSFDLEIIHESLKKELDERQEVNLMKLESHVDQFSR